MNRDDRWALVGPLALLASSVPMALVGQRGLALAEVAFSLILLITIFVGIRLRHFYQRRKSARPTEIIFRSAMALVFGVSVLGLGAFLALHLNPIISIIVSVPLGSFFILAAWINIRSNQTRRHQ